MPTVELERCGPDRRTTLENLIQLYTHDFSEYWVGTDRGQLQEDGRFPPYPDLDLYWAEADRSAWLIRADGDLAGMALINAHSHCGLPLDHAMAEFFVARKHRLAGIGGMAARKLIAERPGQWELAVARANTAALRFWTGVAESLTPHVDVLDMNDGRWNGAVLRFRVAGTSPA